MNKAIENIVFYKFWDPTREEQMQQACIFYADGTVKNATYEDGKELANEIAIAEKIKTKAEFVKLINTKRIYTMVGTEFERRFKEFLGKGTALVPVSSATSVAPVVAPPVTTGKTKAPANSDSSFRTPTASDLPGTKPAAPVVVPPTTVPGATTSSAEPTVGSDKPRTSHKDKKKQARKKKKEERKAKRKAAKAKRKAAKAQRKAEREKKPGLFKRLWVKVTSLVLAGAMLFTGGFFLGRNTKSGKIINNNISAQNQNTIEPQDQAYLNLLSKSTNDDQKESMKQQGQSLDSFNKDFANAYVEDNQNIKASLTWDEMMALNLAYNTYNKEQIQIMFNGAEVDAKAMSDAYKNATLQLMGAYVISSREHPVNSSAFLINPEQKTFVEKYNNLFLTMKETTGEEQINAVKAFYAELYKDFPISTQTREEGISHADSRNQVEAYKAAIVPMVAAAEIMFQNVSSIDHTLSTQAIAYFNDLGFCNLVEDKFQRAETITLTAETDESQPQYIDFRNAKITELIYEGNYPTDDAHRDLSMLNAFQKWVDAHFELVEGNNTGTLIPNQPAVTPPTTTETNDRTTAVQHAGEGAVQSAENQATADLEAQNKNAQQQAQVEANQTSSAAKQEAAKDAADMQEKIDNANNALNNGDTVNEDDFGDHNVDFSDEFEDGNGNLNDSVTNITTDGSGAQTEEDLPDPNQTGAVFDGVIESTTQDDVDDDTYQYEEPYTSMTNEQIVDAYIASLEGKGSVEPPKTYTK